MHIVFLHHAIGNDVKTVIKNTACVCVFSVCLCSYLRVNFENKVFLLFELRDGLQHVAHGQDSTAVWPTVLNVWRTLLTVVQQHPA